MKLFSQQYGEGDALIILHGLFGMSDNLAPVGKRLADRRRVILPDQRNHGRSPHHATMNYPVLAQDILQLMDDEQIERADVLGHSMGGKVAMQLAVLCPQRFHRVIVADIAPVQYPRHHDLVFAGLFAVRDAQCTTRTQVDQVLASFVSDAGVRQFLAKSLHKGDDNVLQWRFNIDALHQHYDAVSAPPVQGQSFDGPALVIKGENSNYMLPEHRDAFAHFLPRANYQTIAGTGHWLHAEKPAEFTTLVADFLDGRAG
jgi:esterase